MRWRRRLTSYSKNKLLKLDSLAKRNERLILGTQSMFSFIYAYMYISSFLLDIIELAENKTNQIMSVKYDSTVKHLYRFTVVIL